MILNLTKKPSVFNSRKQISDEGNTIKGMPKNSNYHLIKKYVQNFLENKV